MYFVLKWCIKGTELFAICLGMDVCLSKRFSNIHVFSDSVQAVGAAINQDEDIGPNGSIAHEIHSLMKTFPNIFISINHMSRKVNGAAHTLVRKSLTSHLEFECYSWDIMASWLLDIVNFDISNSS